MERLDYYYSSRFRNNPCSKFPKATESCNLYNGFGVTAGPEGRFLSSLSSSCAGWMTVVVWGASILVEQEWILLDTSVCMLGHCLSSYIRNRSNRKAAEKSPAPPAQNQRENLHFMVFVGCHQLSPTILLLYETCTRYLQKGLGISFPFRSRSAIVRHLFPDKRDLLRDSIRS